MPDINQIKWIVYIIQSKSGKLYTGITKNMERRLAAQTVKKRSPLFHFSPPKEVIFQELHPNRSEASKREIAIKKMTRKEKLLLTEKLNCK